MFPIDFNYNGGIPSDLSVNKTMGIRFPPLEALHVHIPRDNNSVPMNPIHYTPLLSPYVPNLPIQPVCSYYTGNGSNLNAKTYHPSTTIQGFSSSRQWDCGANIAHNIPFSSHYPSPVKDDRNAYDNTNYMNTYACNGYSQYNYNYNRSASYQSATPSTANPGLENYSIYSQTNQTNYSYRPENSCSSNSNQGLLCPANYQPENHAFKGNNDGIPSQNTSCSNGSGPAQFTATSIATQNCGPDLNEQAIHNPPASTSSSFENFTQNAVNRKASKGKANNNANAMLVSLPGGQPLFSVPLNNPTENQPPKKRRGRPPKPKPPPSQVQLEDSRNTKVRYRRGTSHLQLLQAAPNLNPCVSTLEGLQYLRMKSLSNPTIGQSVGQGSSTITTGETDADIQIVGCFPQGTTSVNAFRLERENGLGESKPVAIPSGSGITNTKKENGNFRVNDPREYLTARGEAVKLSKEKIHMTENHASHNAPWTNSCQGVRNRILQETKFHYNKEHNSDRQSVPDNYQLNINVTHERENFGNKTRKTKPDVENNKICDNRNNLPKYNGGDHKSQNLMNGGQLVVQRKSTSVNLNSKPSLDMPNIFDFMDMPNTSNLSASDDTAQSDNLSDLEEMMNLHLTCDATTRKSPVKFDQAQKQLSVPKTVKSPPEYFPSFLSEDSDSDSEPEKTQEPSTLEVSANHSKSCQRNLLSSDDDENSKVPMITSVNQMDNAEDISFHSIVSPLHNVTLPSTYPVNDAAASTSQNCPVFKSCKSLHTEGNWHAHCFDSAAGSSSDTTESNVLSLSLFDNRSGQQYVSEAADGLNTPFTHCQQNHDSNNSDTYLPRSPPSPFFISLWSELANFNKSEPMPEVNQFTVQKPIMNNLNQQRRRLSMGESASAFVRVLPTRKRRMSGESNTGFSYMAEGTQNDDFAFDLSLASHERNIHAALEKPIPIRRKSDPAKRYPFHSSPILTNKNNDNLRRSQNLARMSTLHDARNHEHMRSSENSFAFQANKDATSKIALDVADVGRKVAYDKMGNRVVKRMAHRIHLPELSNKQQIIVHTSSSQERKESTQGQKSLCRTNPMIKKLIKFAGRQNTKTKTVINETKSKLNADLNKVFLLGNNPTKRKFGGAEKKLKEVLLEIPGPMERRAKLRDLVKEKEPSLSLTKAMQPSGNKKHGKKIASLNNLESQHSPPKMVHLSEDEENKQSGKVHPRTKDDLLKTGKVDEQESCDAHFLERNDDFEDDDADILDLHAERDSLLEMFH